MADNSLLACLAQLGQITGRPTSLSTLVAGLPITEDKLSVELFPRAAARINLHAKLQNFPLKPQLSHFTIPLVLLLQDHQACLLTDITNTGTAKLIFPPKEEVVEIPLEELLKLYSGQAFIIDPSYNFSSRTSDVAKESNDKIWFWNAVKKLWSAYGEMLVASLLINLFAIALPLFTMNVYDRVIPNRSYTTLWVLATGIFIVFLFDFLMRALRSYFIDQAGKLVDLQVSANILEKIMGIKLVERPASIGSFANTISSFDAVRDFITSTTITILVDLPFAIIFIIIIGFIGGNIVWVPILLLPLVMLFGFLLQKPLIEYTKISHRFAAEKQAILYEILSSIETVKAHCAERVMQNRWEQVINHSAQIGIKLRFIVNLGMFFSILAQQLSTVLIVIFGVYLISQNELTTGGLIACTILASRALAPMAQIASLLTRYHQTVSALNSLNDVMQLAVERPTDRSLLHVPPLKGEIDIRDVSFSYKDRAAPVLQHISIKVSPGEHIAIIGRVGSGKSTLAKLLLGLLQPTSGSIFFDGIDQSHFDISELRLQIGYVPQDILLFYGTIRDNITFGAPHVEDSKIIRAIEISGVDQLVIPFIGSYEAQIGEGGKRLSGGQRQIIAITRAVLMDPPILVLDEPTHSMDSQTELAIKNKLDSYLSDKTFILMTHRTSLLSLVNRIIILDAGKIVVDGPKDVVLQLLSEGKIKVPKV